MTAKQQLEIHVLNGNMYSKTGVRREKCYFIRKLVPHEPQASTIVAILP